MPTRFRRAALVGKYQASGISPVLEEIAQFLVLTGLEVFLDKGTASDTGLTSYPALDVSELGEQCDVAIVLGGDGTMLSIAREMSRYGVPLVGINAGRLGFITDLPQADFHETLGPMIAGDYEEERRTMLEGNVCRDGVNLFEGFAMNDVVVSRGATTSMVELKLSIDSEFVANWRADGLIIASPTGSTAYSLSAGGPILHPGIHGWVLVPVAPHALSNRPIVLPDSGHITIEIVAGRDATANFDMHGVTSLMRGDCINVSRSANQVRFLHPRGWSYYATLRRKLHWNEGVT